MRTNTKSLCDGCLDIVDAKVIYRGGKAYVSKACPKHGKMEALHVWDDERINKAMRSLVPKKVTPSRGVVLNVTTRCDLNCRFCYANIHQIPYSDMPIDEIKRRVDSYDGDTIYLSGGEPATRKDIFDIISHIKSRKKKAILFTNGLKLSDKAFAKSLKDSGVDLVILSLDTLSGKDEHYHGRSIGRLKDAALTNLKDLGIPVYVFVMVSGKRNKDEIKGFYRLLSDSRGAIRILNFNPVWEVGRTGSHDKAFTTGQIVEEVTRQAGITRDDLISCTRFSHTVSRMRGIITGKDENTQAPCELKCYVVHGKGGLVPLTRIFSLDKIDDSINSVLDKGGNKLGKSISLCLRLSPIILHDIMKDRRALWFALKTVSQFTGKRLNPKRYAMRHMSSIIIGSFPTASNIDLMFTKGCNLYSDIEGRDDYYSACVQQIFKNKGVGMDGFMRKRKEALDESS